MARAFTGVVVERIAASMPPAKVAEIAGMIAGRGYTADELAYCAYRLPFDEKVGESIQYKTTNPYWILPHIERIIVQGRRLRRRLTDGLLTQWDIGQIMSECPEIRRHDFQWQGFDDKDRPLFKYAPGVQKSPEARAMQKLHGRGND